MIAKLGQFSKLFFIITAVFFIVNAVMISIEQKNIYAGVVDIGQKLIYSTEQLADASNEIYERGNVVDLSKGYFNLVATYWNLMTSFLGVLLWIRIFTAIIKAVFNFPAAVNFPVGLVAFIFLQSFLLLFLGEGNKYELVLKPLLCLWHFIRIVPLLIDPFRNMVN